ncbi:centrosomal protein of 126 kDa [Centroberyx affinis]|uniref:centrosomal protein of 126 kDa n=1 Tax=Centroberyx affinis TaxID=166261 RepID=UPI003A5B9E82
MPGVGRDYEAHLKAALSQFEPSAGHAVDFTADCPRCQGSASSVAIMALGADGGLEDERQLLVEEQRSCRSRAHKFSLETNRRRKALEERRKQWDVQEQRLRENILQQRRQRVQDATERFQRAHLPPSQRRRQSFRKNVPNIEDALNQIQGALSSYSRQSSFLSSNSNFSRSCTPSPKPPTASRSSHRRALSAVEAYTKLLQEHSMTGFKSSQQLFFSEIQDAQEKERDTCSPQEHHVYHPSHSESLSSLDSLENEDPSHTAMLLGDNLPQPRKMHDPKPKKQEESEGLNNRMHNPSQATRGFTSIEQTPKTEAQPPLDSKICEVRIIKGILKKQSKYVSGDATSAYGSGHLIFAKQVALTIRDSVELTRAKNRDVEGTKSVKKKLRWFDEVNLEKEDKEQNINIRKQMKGRSSNLSQSKSSPEDHQLSLASVSGASRPGPAMTPPASTGYHFTKQAWADVGVQVSLPQERGDEVKVPQSSTRTAGPKVPRRARSARVGVGPVSSRARKGTVVRPQSATEVSQIAKTQGKIMVPRPPPRMETAEENAGDKTPYITKTPYSVDQAGVNCKQALPVEQASHKDNSKGFFSPYTHHVIRTDSSVVYTPLPPSYTCPVLEGSTKGTPSSAQQETQGCGGRRGLVYNEKGLCLDCTPTDEEISQLWHGVRTALATKDGDPRNFLTHNGPLSALPQARANLSHVTINGDSLISGVKAVTRMGGFFLSPSNARSLVRRPALESGGGGVGVRRKTGAEPSRQLAPGSGNRRFPLPSQPTKQATDPARPFSSTYDVALPYEGLESAAQFHLAEMHGEGLLEERDIMAAMETAQTQRPGAVQQRGQQQGLTTISLEEQKILLSLDRLNHQLHCVQEHAGGSAAVRGLVHIDAPATREGKATIHHRHRTFSADSRSRNQRKF